MSVQEDLETLLAPLIVDLGYEYVGMEYRANPKNRLLRLYIDRSENGIGLDDCERVSREVSALLDVEDPISGHYTLEVSSPGVKRRLFTLEQFARFAGRDAVVHVHAPVGGRRKFRGRILRAGKGRVVLEADVGELTLEFADIRRAKLEPGEIPIPARKTQDMKQ